jgi:hypothetical protein
MRCRRQWKSGFSVIDREALAAAGAAFARIS